MRRDLDLWNHSYILAILTQVRQLEVHSRHWTVVQAVALPIIKAGSRVGLWGLKIPTFQIIN